MFIPQHIVFQNMLGQIIQVLIAIGVLILVMYLIIKH